MHFDLGYLDTAHAVHAELQFRTAGCVVVILQVLVMPGELPCSPSVSCAAQLFMCVCACIQDCVCLLWHISRMVKAKTTGCQII